MSLTNTQPQPQTNEKVIFISTTRGSKDNTLFLKSIRKVPGAEFEVIENNTEKLCVLYNRMAVKYMDSHDIICFIHDDVYVDDLKAVTKLQKAVRENAYDVIGLAGGIGPVIRTPALWHLMCQRENLRGAVAHPAGDNQSIFVTNFGHTPSEVDLIDNLFMAFRTKLFKINSNFRFDEANPCHTHFTDMDISLQARKYGYRVGVWPIWTIHTSPGLRSFEDLKWQTGQKWFLEKWSK
jgi:GT2 family glycosyltransferase